MNLSTIYKVFDTVASVLDFKKDDAREQHDPSGVSQASPPSFADQVEARLTNVVLAALKEAFDRDHARLELERTHLEEQRRRAEETLRLERQRQAVDREIGRLRFLAGAGLAGWLAAVVLLAARSSQIAGPSRIVLAVACVLLLGSVGSAFSAQGQVGDRMRESDAVTVSTGTASLWLLLAGLALAAGSLLF